MRAGAGDDTGAPPMMVTEGFGAGALCADIARQKNHADPTASNAIAAPIATGIATPRRSGAGVIPPGPSGGRSRFLSD